MWSSRHWRRPSSPRPSPPRSNWCARGWPRSIRKSLSRRSTCASVSARTELCPRMTRKKTPKETAMPSVAKKPAIVPKDEPPPLAERSGAAEARPEELRRLGALLFAAGEPLDEATLARQLPNGVELKDALARLKAEYAPR